MTATAMSVLLLHVSAWSNVTLLVASQAGTGYPGPDAIPSLSLDAETVRAFVGAMLAHGATLLVLTVLCAVGRWQLQGAEPATGDGVDVSGAVTRPPY
ncbi:hypothetical protein, partial [Clavibacter phaseoli]|uniref:hypothetical protein n=1 Tax=Clavibacter phaseoli TaxID=1734031 RepID=UPI0015FA64B7